MCVCCHRILTQMLQMWMLLLLLKRNASKYYLRLLYFYFISLHGIWWRPANLFVLPCRTPSCPVMQRCSSVTHPVFFFADLIQANRYSMAKRKQTNEVGGKNISRKCFMAIFFSWNTLRHMKPVYKRCMYRTRKCTHKAHHLFKNRIPNWRLLCYFILRKSLPAIDIGVSDWLLFFVNLIIYICAYVCMLFGWRVCGGWGLGEHTAPAQQHFTRMVQFQYLLCTTPMPKWERETRFCICLCICSSIIKKGILYSVWRPWTQHKRTTKQQQQQRTSKRYKAEKRSKQKKKTIAT